MSDGEAGGGGQRGGQPGPQQEHATEAPQGQHFISISTYIISNYLRSYFISSYLCIDILCVTDNVCYVSCLLAKRAVCCVHLFLRTHAA